MLVILEYLVARVLDGVEHEVGRRSHLRLLSAATGALLPLADGEGHALRDCGLRHSALSVIQRAVVRVEPHALHEGVLGGLVAGVEHLARQARARQPALHPPPRPTHGRHDLAVLLLLR